MKLTDKQKHIMHSISPSLTIEECELIYNALNSGGDKCARGATGRSHVVVALMKKELFGMRKYARAADYSSEEEALVCSEYVRGVTLNAISKANHIDSQVCSFIVRLHNLKDTGKRNKLPPKAEGRRCKKCGAETPNYFRCSKCWSNESCVDIPSSSWALS
jgi:hypothetical protein